MPRSIVIANGGGVKCLTLLGLSMTFFVANIASTSIAIVIFDDILPSLGCTSVGESLGDYRGGVIACVVFEDGLPSCDSSPGPIHVATAFITFFNGCVAEAGRGKTERRWQLDTITITNKCPQAPVITTLPSLFHSSDGLQETDTRPNVAAFSPTLAPTVVLELELPKWNNRFIKSLKIAISIRFDYFK